nr:MAG TPA: hypothetical protein [Caudoviricetes sp.]
MVAVYDVTVAIDYLVVCFFPVLLSRGLFIPHFLQFPVSSAYILDYQIVLEQSWEHYIYSAPTLYTAY